MGDALVFIFAGMAIGAAAVALLVSPRPSKVKPSPTEKG